MDIYSAVIQQLGSDRDLARRYEVVYVVNGAISGAGHPKRDPFGPAKDKFDPEVLAGIRQRIGLKLPPLEFVADGDEALRRPGELSDVKGEGVLISLGPIETTSGRAYVGNTLWCGGKCSQWQTYVISQRNGRWSVTGIRGRLTAS